MISTALGPQFETFVASLVEAGRYTSKSEVLREGIRLVQQRETRLATLDQALARSLSDAEAGRVRTATEVFSRLEVKYRAPDHLAE
ncbi:type II toxin-antitoxin system ParD family antitoxin [Paracoccus lutimaris]|uniref:Antitoxin ParD1/3/4 n=1 Tax=Paracoccus lutimaris TaxID=1490030 RepID=A0A368Z7J1_9RHOB|nr:type II toxin-antitoxin system ParD family antitoxin [Paracoccus lutimaris]RCW87127.1 antitoxin ParD1/3/4 [Paracoccus lutimaris]